MRVCACTYTHTHMHTHNYTPIIIYTTPTPTTTLTHPNPHTDTHTHIYLSSNTIDDSLRSQHTAISIMQRAVLSRPWQVLLAGNKCLTYWHVGHTIPWVNLSAGKLLVQYLVVVKWHNKVRTALEEWCSRLFHDLWWVLFKTTLCGLFVIYLCLNVTYFHLFTNMYLTILIFCKFGWKYKHHNNYGNLLHLTAWTLIYSTIGNVPSMNAFISKRFYYWSHP